MIFTQEQLAYMYETKSFYSEPIINELKDLIGFNVIEPIWNEDNIITGNKVFIHYTKIFTLKEYTKFLNNYE